MLTIGLGLTFTCSQRFHHTCRNNDTAPDIVLLCDNFRSEGLLCSPWWLRPLVTVLLLRKARLMLSLMIPQCISRYVCLPSSLFTMTLMGIAIVTKATMICHLRFWIYLIFPMSKWFILNFIILQFYTYLLIQLHFGIQFIYKNLHFTIILAGNVHMM